MAISANVVPSLVSSHLSDVSFQRRTTFADEPRVTSIPAFSVGAAVTLLFKTMMLSSTVSVSVLIDVVVPETVKFPLTVTSLAVTVPVKVGDASGALSSIWA